MSTLVSRLSLSKEIRKNFASFYVFGDNSVVKKDLVGKNDLTYYSGTPSIFYGRHGRAEHFDGTKYLLNRSITPTVTGFPFFIYIDVHDNGDASLDGESISLSPWISDYTKQIQIFMEGSATNKVRTSLTESGATSYSNASKSIPSRVYTASLIVRSYSDFTLFVNGEKLTPWQTSATGFTTKNSIVIGRRSNGYGDFRGGVFSAGWGTVDPGDDFLRRLTISPLETIFGRGIHRIDLQGPGPVYTNKQRRTFSPTGSRMGSRQAT
jgi:hypothetical protein